MGKRPYFPEEHPYPSWRYKGSGDNLESCVVKSVDEDEALGSGWRDSPGKKKAAAKKPDPPVAPPVDPPAADPKEKGKKTPAAKE